MAKKLNKAKTVILVFLIVLSGLVSIQVINYKNNIEPEKVALSFTQAIVNNSDGYSAFNYTLVCKNYKYEDYVRENYIYPIIYAESHYQPGVNINNLKGLNSDSYIGEKTKNDNGTLEKEVIDKMFPYYVQLMTELDGWDKYNTFYVKYLAKLLEVRQEVFNDRYMTEEIIFSALESNINTYSAKLRGTEDVTEENENRQDKKSVGLYETKYGKNYAFTYTVTETKNIEIEEYREHVDEATFKTYKTSADDIQEAKAITIKIQVNSKTVLESFKLLVVKTDGNWYVDNTNTKTSELYNFYK